MKLREERELIIKYGVKMVEAGLTTGTGGNISIISSDRTLAAVTPSGVEYREILAHDVVVADMDGQVVDGKGKPSSELFFHLALYRKRKDISCVVHTHSPYATTLACLNWELPAAHYLVGFAGNRVPLAPYATFGTEALAENICNTIGSYNAVLMANHGLVAVGPDIARAFTTAEEVEFAARVYFQGRCVGNPVILSNAEMAVITEKFKDYGRGRS